MNLELKNKVIDCILNNKQLENIRIHITNDSYDNVIIEFYFKTNSFSDYKKYSNNIDNCIKDLKFPKLGVDIKSDNIYKDNIIGLNYERNVVVCVRQQ